jgi:hypothetical protein
MSGTLKLVARELASISYIYYEYRMLDGTPNYLMIHIFIYGKGGDNYHLGTDCFVHGVVSAVQKT